MNHIKITTLSDLNRLIPVSSVSKFDPADFVDTNASVPYVRAAMRNSMAWYADIMATNQVRALFFSAFTQALTAGVVEDYNGFISYLAKDQAANDFLYGMILSENQARETGQDEREGFRSLQTMLLLRQQWHADAEDLCSSVPGLRHVESSMEAVLRGQKPLPLSKLQLEKMRVVADLSATNLDTGEIDKKLADEVYTETVKRENESNEARAEAAHDRIPALLRILEVAERNRPDDIKGDFAELPKATRKRFVEQLVQMADNAQKFAQRERTIMSDEFMALLVDVRRMQKSLKNTLVDPGWNDDEIESQAQIDAKRLKSEEDEALAEGFDNLADFRKHKAELGRGLLSTMHARV